MKPLLSITGEVNGDYYIISEVSTVFEAADMDLGGDLLMTMSLKMERSGGW